jgi:hypothetical protein
MYYLISRRTTNPSRRARHQTIRRTKTKNRNSPSHTPQPKHPNTRRSNKLPRCRVRTSSTRSPKYPNGRPHIHHHSPPPSNNQRSRHHLRTRRRQNSRARLTRTIIRIKKRHLQRTSQVAVRCRTSQLTDVTQRTKISYDCLRNS